MDDSPAWGFGKKLITSHCKKQTSYKMFDGAAELAGSCHMV
jgi:hypothetical protein